MKAQYGAHSLNWKLFKDNIETDLNLGDLTVVNAARQSFNRRHEVWDMERDSRLVKYLAEHNHWTPFAHPTITLYFEVPFFVKQQLDKHRIGLYSSEQLPIKFEQNEASRRYVNTQPEFYVHDEYRQTSENVKQGSKNDGITEDQASNILEYLNFDDESDAPFLEQLHGLIVSRNMEQTALYSAMIRGGVCPEQARGVLPFDIYTNYVWTGSLYAWSRICNQRLDLHTQNETRIVAGMIHDIVKELYPVCWEHLIKVDNLEDFRGI